MLGRGDLETQRKSHKCILVLKCLNELVPPYLSGYFIKNCIIHTYNTTQRNNIHLPNPMLPLGKSTFRFSGVVLLIIYPHKYKKLRHFPFLRTFLDFIFAISLILR